MAELGGQAAPARKAAPAAPRPAPRALAADPVGPETRLRDVGGIAEERARGLARLGCQTVADLLRALPRRYEDQRERVAIRDLIAGRSATVDAQVVQLRARPARARRLTVLEGAVADGTGEVRVVWFNQRYLAARLAPGTRVLLHGPVVLDRSGLLQLRNPQIETGEASGHQVGILTPIYHETQGVTSRWLRFRLPPLLPLADRLPDPLPEAVRDEEGLLPLGRAIRLAHFPESPAARDAARERLAFDEVFLVQLAALRARQRRQATPGVRIPLEAQIAREFVAALPFHLTADQRVAAFEILRDMDRPQPMSRLLQGDVGTGKTVVAALAIRMAVQAGYQAVLMAPTELLVRQHLATLRQLLAPSAIAPRLLLGSTPARQRREVLGGLAGGHDAVVVGTHALLEDQVTFNRLGLCVVDEQHRFGVAQRLRLREKAARMPDVLTMTATPIPRSLQLTVFGDLECSRIRTPPPGRRPVATRIVEPEGRDGAYAFIRAEVERGRQGYVICPLIEAGEPQAARAAVDEFERLRRLVFPDLRLTLLHGRLTPREKQERMARFAAGADQLLVATSIVEVGVDVPNATCMLVEGAGRFGLAQLHQFRGRIGRGADASSCLLLAEPDLDERARARLEALVAHDSGFELAELDLRLRGSGDPYGVRQHGLPEMRVASLSDLVLQERARRAAERVLARDPELRDPRLRRALVDYNTVFELD